MCGRKKRDPRIDEEQKRAREAAEAAKQQALEKQEQQRASQLEREREAAASAAAKAEADAAKAARQAELDMQVGELDNTGKPMRKRGGLFRSKAAQRRSRSARSGRRGRRSLLTSSGGGVGYFSRVL